MGKQELRSQLQDREAGLASYELFFTNMGLGFGLKEAVEKKIGQNKKIRVFDLGCGKAVALGELKQVFGERVFAIGLDAIKEENHQIDEFITGDALQEEFPKNCDIVVSFRAMHEIGSCKKIIEKIEKSLAEKGRAFLSIRCQEFKDNRIRNLGKITQKDMDFLLGVLEKKSFGTLKIAGKAVPVLLEGVVVDRTGKKGIGRLAYIAGVNTFLQKT